MNRILKKFLQRGVDLSPVGVELREDNTNYFCTPKGASVFWMGRDRWYPLLFHSWIWRDGFLCQPHEYFS